MKVSFTKSILNKISNNLKGVSNEVELNGHVTTQKIEDLKIEDVVKFTELNSYDIEAILNALINEKVLLDKIKSIPDLSSALFETIKGTNEIELLKHQGSFSLTFLLGNDYILKVRRNCNYSIPKSEYVAQPYIQFKLDVDRGVHIEIYDRFIQPTEQEIDRAYPNLKALLSAHGIFVDDYNRGSLMINPKTGKMTLVDTDDVRRIRDEKVALENHEKNYIRYKVSINMSDDNFSFTNPRPFPVVPINVLESSLFFPKYLLNDDENAKRI